MKEYLEERIKQYKHLEDYYIDMANKLEDDDNYKMFRKEIAGIEKIVYHYQIRRRETQKIYNKYLKFISY